MRTVRHFANLELELEVVWEADWKNPQHGSTPAVCRRLNECDWCKEVCTCSEKDRDYSWYGGEIDKQGEILYYVNLYDDKGTAMRYARSLIFEPAAPPTNCEYGCPYGSEEHEARLWEWERTGQW